MTLRVRITDYIPAPIVKGFEDGFYRDLGNQKNTALTKGESLQIGAIALKYTEDGTIVFGELGEND